MPPATSPVIRMKLPGSPLVTIDAPDPTSTPVSICSHSKHDPALPPATSIPAVAVIVMSEMLTPTAPLLGWSNAFVGLYPTMLTAPDSAVIVEVPPSHPQPTTPKPSEPETPTLSKSLANPGAPPTPPTPDNATLPCVTVIVALVSVRPTSPLPPSPLTPLSPSGPPSKPLPPAPAAPPTPPLPARALTVKPWEEDMTTESSSTPIPPRPPSPPSPPAPPVAALGPA